MKEPTCGDHKPIIITRYGIVPEKAALAAETIVGTITAIHPKTDLNVLGADNITLSGTNFPHQLEGSTFELVFDDALKTKCVP